MNEKSCISILWLEDDPRSIFNHIKKLEELGFHIVISNNVTEAIYEAEHCEFDIIIADLLMPPPDGTDFLSRVRPLHPNSMFIVFTGYPYNNIYRQRIKELKFDVNLLQKSDGFPALIMCIFQALCKYWPKIDFEKKNIWERIITAVDIKPGFGGITIDIKKLIGRSSM